MPSAAIEYCTKKGVWMPEGHCAGGNSYYRKARQGVAAFLEATQGYRRGVCVQAGGHVGFWPQELARVYEAVLTFEPHPANYRALAANVTASNVYPFRAALGDGCDFGLCGIEERPNIGGHNVRDAEGDISEAIPMGALDAFEFQQLDALVLDTEGAELMAIEGALLTIERHRPVILAEELGHIEKKVKVGSTQELYDLLENLRYTPGPALGHDRLWWPQC